jgi:ABC-2 type transport system ATP-binding protein
MPAFFRKNGPKWHVDHGRRLDIPVLFGQGTTDSLFPLQQGLANWHHAITPAARRHSIFVAYNGGHVLPAVLPRGVEVTSDPCSKELAGGDFEQLSLRFFDEQLRGRDTGLTGYGRYHLATPDSTCTTVASVRANTEYAVGTVATTEAGGAPLAYPVVAGPVRVAGTPYLTGSLTALGANNRAFYGLAIGTSPADAHLVQDNVLPLNELAPVIGETRRIDLPSVAVDVPEGQTLYVLASPVSDTFVGMGSRTPGAVILDDTVVHLPVVGR